MYYTVYKTTNKINGKIYVGSHKTADLQDDYLGSGTLLTRAVHKHGKNNFIKEILFVFDNPDEMFAKEADIVTQAFLDNGNCYNIKLGGRGGFDHINSDESILTDRNRKISSNRDYNDPEFRKKVSVAVRKADKEGRRKYNKFPNWKGKVHSEETKKKMSITAKNRQKGSHSQLGTFWVTDGVTNLKLKGGSDISDGWHRGRTTKH